MQATSLKKGNVYSQGSEIPYDTNKYNQIKKIANGSETYQETLLGISAVGGSTEQTVQEKLFEFYSAEPDHQVNYLASKLSSLADDKAITGVEKQYLSQALSSMINGN